jgi:ribosome-binding factor A
MGSDAERESTFEGLKSLAHHLRSRVGRALRLQFAPEIVFKLDQSVARAARIETLLASLKTPPPADAPADPAEPDDSGH